MRQKGYRLLDPCQKSNFNERSEKEEIVEIVPHQNEEEIEGAPSKKFVMSVPRRVSSRATKGNRSKRYEVNMTTMPLEPQTFEEAMQNPVLAMKDEMQSVYNNNT